MDYRRCAGLFVEPRERPRFALEALLAGGDGVEFERTWVAYAPHLGGEHELDESDVVRLGRLPVHAWSPASRFDADERAALDRLVACGLVVAREGESFVDPAVADLDARQRAQHWRPLSAVAHAYSRWRGVGTPADLAAQPRSLAELIERFGPPPVAVLERGVAADRIALAEPERDALDATLHARATCRNFATRGALSAADFARVVDRTLRAHASVEIEPGHAFLKKNTPSGGGLHPVEAYLIVRRIEGLAAGLYHYHPVAHALEPVEAGSAPIDALATTAVAGQAFLADADVLVVLAARFERCFWKYRNHAKAYRVILLEAGCIVQTLYLACAERGIGAFVTAAINEVELEAAFGLDPLEQGVIAVCGFGRRADAMTTAEFDPLARAWPVEPDARDR
ncbi:MAG TPA: putative peptide maturation dehydrogenase [Candidatus Saccharimonadia bacterium]|nr:putative peptide maturation dehydrogenase [Candidatus Saccharimonadia bacterium]